MIITSQLNLSNYFFGLVYKESMSASKNDIFNSRGPFHDSIIKERKEKQVEAEQSEHTACNAMQEENKHTGS